MVREVGPSVGLESVGVLGYEGRSVLGYAVGAGTATRPTWARAASLTPSTPTSHRRPSREHRPTTPLRSGGACDGALAGRRAAAVEGRAGSATVGGSGSHPRAGLWRVSDRRPHRRRRSHGPDPPGGAGASDRGGGRGGR